MKRLIVIILVLVLVAGGGAGGLIMLGIIPNPFAPAMKPSLTAAERAAQSLDKRKFQPPLSAYKLVKMDDMIVPVILNGEVRRRVYITARIMAAGPQYGEAVKTRLGQFQNVVIADLVPFFQNYFADHDTLDPISIKDHLRADAKQVYGDKITDVLLVNVFDQNIGRAP
jgi:hypothetical protein